MKYITKTVEYIKENYFWMILATLLIGVSLRYYGIPLLVYVLVAYMQAEPEDDDES